MSAPPVSRHFDNDGPIQTLKRSPREEILANVEKLVTKYPPESIKDELFGVFAGPTSLAYLLFQLSEPGTGYDEIKVADRTLREWANAYLDSATKNYSHELDKDMHPQSCYGYIVELPARLAVTAAFRKDENAAKELVALLPEVVAYREDVWNEPLFGRTGYLYLLRLVRTFWPEAPIPSDAYKQIIDRVMLDGEKKWKFVDAYYMGAGHGWISIITQILLTDQSYAAACKPALTQILDEQVTAEGNDDYGNWDGFLAMEGKTETRLQIQWGHGAPGIVISLQSILPAYQESDPELAARIQKAIETAQDVIWKKGLLRKESCICHGAAGNMLALTDEKQREHFMAFSTEEVVQRGLEDGSSEASSYPSSLFRGLGSRTWAFYALEKGLWTCPAYNDL